MFCLHCRDMVNEFEGKLLRTNLHGMKCPPTPGVVDLFSGGSACCVFHVRTQEVRQQVGCAFDSTW